MSTKNRFTYYIAVVLVFQLFLCLEIHGDLGADQQRVKIRVMPRNVFPSIVYKLRLETSREAANKYWNWSVSAGELLSNGEVDAFWKSPSKPGEVILRVAVLDDNGNESATITATLPINVGRPSTDNMIFIPAGSFTMGDTWTDTTDLAFIPTFQNIVDKPAHLVELESYWIDRNKVTNQQFADFLNDFYEQGLARVDGDVVVGLYEGVEVPFYYFKIEQLEPGGRPPELRQAITWDGKSFQVKKGQKNHAVMDVTWSGSISYAFYHGKRLPTEAEWGKAARGTDGREFPWGNDLPTKYHANVNAFFGDNLLPVGSFSPTGDSPYGVADVLGGFEWVVDWFGDYYFWDNYSEKPFKNPRGPMWGYDHTVRGIGVFHTFFGDRFNLEPLSFRYQWVFEYEHGHLFAHKDTGFRLALTPF